MEQLRNFIKANAGGLDGQAGVARFGLVSSFDPAVYAARILLQPENVLTGWLPVISPWVGAGWGLAAPLLPGAQVLVIAQEGDAEQGVVMGAIWSAVDQPMAAPVGELWLRHQSGSCVKLLNDGTILLQASQVNVMGNLMVSGDISDANGVHGTLAALRQAHDQHAHGMPQGGVTGLPTVTV
ncbi:phage baseplate assembly protein V [Acidocella sp.]|uniref:phage baseplate assembly protein V n=1 Tax=Acidocella sp. TaxID=50710 RepID=UPI0026313AD1|nr:phage baseplate assembly protein V [Acidocella sp.]